LVPVERAVHRRTALQQVIASGPGHGTISGVPTIRIAQDAAADELLSRDPLALLIGMLLDHRCVNEAVDVRAGGLGQHDRGGLAHASGATGAERASPAVVPATGGPPRPQSG
jgi:hypothetical protein